MQTQYGQDRDDVQPLRDALAERPGRPIRLRLQPTIQRAAAAKRSQYQVWPDVSWTVDCDSVEEAVAFREALRAFFVAIAHEGADALTARLQRKGAAA